MASLPLNIAQREYGELPSLRIKNLQSNGDERDGIKNNGNGKEANKGGNGI